MKTIEELEALLETVTRERDLSLFAWEAAGMTGRTAQGAMLELARQLEEACSEIAALTTALDERDVEAERSLEQYDRLVRERDEARAEVDRLTDERDELLVRVAQQEAELRATRESYNEARAEVDRLKRERDAACMAAGEYSQDEVNAMTTEMIAIRKGYEKNAYRRGAEAMRDECIGAACGFYMGTTGFCNGDEDELEAVLEALPIPEEP